VWYNAVMANYNDRPQRGGPRDERRSTDRPRFDRDRSDTRQSIDRPAPQLHPATCSKCGKSCMVPFIATGNRPIFCRDCFRTEGGRDDRGSDDRRGGATRDQDRRMYDAVCDKCGNRCQVPFQPREGKEVLCSHCFEQKGKEERNTFETRPQPTVDLSAVNAKLDKILKLLESMEIVAIESENVEDEITVTAEKPTEEAEVVTEAKPAKKKAAPKKKTAPKTK
jgi:CxxC-x17-CxxC domain-containing protein